MTTLIIMAAPEDLGCLSAPHFLISSDKLTGRVDALLTAMDGDYAANDSYYGYSNNFKIFEAEVLPFLFKHGTYHQTPKIVIPKDTPVTRVIMLCCGGYDPDDFPLS